MFCVEVKANTGFTLLSGTVSAFVFIQPVDVIFTSTVKVDVAPPCKLFKLDAVCPAINVLVLSNHRYVTGTAGTTPVTVMLPFGAPPGKQFVLPTTVLVIAGKV